MLVVDAACDLPDQVIGQHGIRVLPFRIRTGQTYMQEARDEARILRSYRAHLISRSEAYAESQPMQSIEIEQFFRNQVITRCDKALFLTIASQRSRLYEQAESAWFNIVTQGYDVRKEAGLAGAFDLKIFDTGAIGPGQAVLARAALMLLQEGLSLHEVILRLERLRKRTFSFCLPSDLQYLYTRAKAKNENSISWGRYFLGTALNLKPILCFHNGQSQAPVKVRSFDAGVVRLFKHVIEQIHRGLLVPYVSIAYSGLLTDVTQHPVYEELRGAAALRGVEVSLVPMSLTVAVNLGAGALTVAFVATDADLH